MKIDISTCSLYQEGSGAKIYRFKDKIIKIPKVEYWGNLEEEFEIHKQLFERGLRVAEPHDLVEILNPDLNFRLKQNLGILMQFIKGPRICDLPGVLKLKATRIYEKELKKCESLGFKIYDEGDYNGLYHPKKGVYLIDFEGWGRN